MRHLLAIIQKYINEMLLLISMARVKTRTKHEAVKILASKTNIIKSSPASCRHRNLRLN